MPSLKEQGLRGVLEKDFEAHLKAGLNLPFP